MFIDRRQVLAGAGAAFASAGFAPRAFAATTLNLSDVLPDTNFQVRNAKRYAEEVAKATNGDVVISVKAGGSLGFKGPEQMRAVRDGLVPMADILTSQQIGDEPIFGTDGIPFLVASPAELKALHKYLRPEFEKTVAKYNQKILYMVPSPAQYMYLKVKTDTVAGLKGIKIRGADKNTVDTCNAVGMAGVQIPWGELIPALASGRVDGVATSATSGVDGKFWEFLKYIYPTNHTWSTNMVNISLDAWNKLSPASQKAMQEIAAKLEPDFWKVSSDEDEISLKTLREKGMEVVPVSKQMSLDMYKMARPLTAAFMERVPASKPIIEAYLKDTGR
ncbi:MAG: TRAP transporter substrate-binding protein [Methylobacteriaceae bacterium]|nr:TRAP transporter substrate-binding protein [Methylobacteriaceae bacterium]